MTHDSLNFPFRLPLFVASSLCVASSSALRRQWRFASIPSVANVPGVYVWTQLQRRSVVIRTFLLMISMNIVSLLFLNTGTSVSRCHFSLPQLTVFTVFTCLQKYLKVLENCSFSCLKFQLFKSGWGIFSSSHCTVESVARGRQSICLRPLFLLVRVFL